MLNHLETANDQRLQGAIGSPLAVPPRACLTIGAPHFRCLGVNGTTLYFQPANVAEVIELGAAQLRKPHVLRLAPLQWWESEFPGKGGCN